MGSSSSIIEELKRLWARTSPAQRIALAGTIGIAAIVAFISFSIASRPDYAPAFTGLRDDEAAAIVSKLKEGKILYELGDSGTIRVPRGQVQEARLLAAAQGLGQKGGSTTGMELFSQPHIGMTEFAEKVNYQRALEGELSRTISRLDTVETARVHLVVPEPSLFKASQKEASASVVIQPKLGRRLDPTQLQGITQIVASSVEGLKPQNIALMDTAGNLLSERSSPGDPVRQNDRKTDIQHALEGRIEDDVTTMLNRVLGPGRAIVRVGADMDWDQYEANTETFSPQNRSPQIRTQRETTESTRGNAGAAGIPGADTGVPIYSSQSGAPGGNAAERRDTTTTYELSKTVEKTVRAPGGVKRLSVAVALDSDVIADAAQVDAISKLVATAAGLDTNRGDLVTLTAMPFAISADAAPTSPDWARQGELILTAARIAAMILGPLFLLLVFRLILNRRKSPAALAAMGSGTRPQGVAGQGAARQVEEVNLPSLPAPTREDLQAIQVEREVTEYARKDPAVVAQIIRTWMQEDSGVA